MSEEHKEEAQPQEDEQDYQEDNQEEESQEESSEEGQQEEGESAETLKEKLERTAKENKELREYKKRAEKRLKQAQKDDAPESQVNEIREELDSMKLQQQNPDLTPEDIEEIKTYARGAGVSILEAYQNPILQSGINQSIEQRKNEQATPKDKKRGVSKLNLDPSEIDLENPEHVQALKDNPELKKEFKEHFGKQFKR